MIDPNRQYIVFAAFGRVRWRGVSRPARRRRPGPRYARWRGRGPSR